MRVHTVKKGETLWKIARQYGISFEDMKRLNAHLANPDYIVPGMELFLPDAPKKELPQNQEKESPKAQSKEQPIARPKEQPVAPQPKERPVAQPKEQPVAPKPKEQPIARPKEQPVARPKEQPIARPKEQPVAPPKEKPIVKPKEMPKEQPIKVKEQPKPPKEMPIPIEEPKPIPHIHPFEEARPVRARIEIIEQHEEEFFIKPEQQEFKQEPICEPCSKETQMPAPMPIPTPPMPMPPAMPMPMQYQPIQVPCQPIQVPCQPIVAQPQPCGCGGQQMMQSAPMMQPVPMMQQWPAQMQQWPTQNMAQQWSESMMSPMDGMPMAASNWNMPESTKELESSLYENPQQQQEESWQNMQAIPYAQYAEPWNFASPMSYQQMPYQHMMWPGHCCTPYPPVHHYPQPQPYYMQGFPQAGNEWQ